ncbi:MAG: threonine--tRNA ligase [Planctomycetota bacterium]
MPTAILPDGSRRDLPDGATPYDLAKTIGEKLAEAAVGARVDGELVDAHRPLPDGEHEVALVTAPRVDKKDRSKWRDEQHEKDALYLLRHSTAHVMAEAIQRIRPDAVLAYGPPLETGFYYDIAIDPPISSDDFGKIEAEMASIVRENRPFSRYDLPTSEGRKRLEAEGNKYKLDNADRAIEKGADTLSWYVTGQKDENWEDLCMGPHVPSTGRIGAIKVTSTASSHWHGDVNSDRFQRIYGTAFYTQGDLDAHMEALAEARKRDHRVLGPQLGLYTIDNEVGQGLVLWKPKGTIIRNELQAFITEHLTRQGYSQVVTPHIGKLDLFRTSGHYPYYADSQFPPLVDYDTIEKLGKEGKTCADLADMLTKGEVDGYLLKPMNCPAHVRLYASEPHSYRDLPVRIAEFGTVYRWEQSGELGGMTRVRGFTQDDAHIFCTEEQLAAEIQGCLELVKVVLEQLGLSEYRVRVGLRDPDSSKYVGDPAQWDRAEKACTDAAESLGVAYASEAGEAAFYGPKIDFVVKDVLGREWQLGTVQVDYQLPQRFDLSYVGSDNSDHRPVMIHRAPFGSMERFVGVLIEHFAGAFPLWLAPEQVRVLPISDKFNDYANHVAAALRAAGLRTSVDDAADKVGAKIRTATTEKVPYMLVCGGKEAEAGTVSLRGRTAGDLGVVPLDEAVTRLVAERDERRLLTADQASA